MNAIARGLLVTAVLATASYASAVLTPQREIGSANLRLRDLIPENFGEWTAEPSQPGSQVLVVPNAAAEPAAAQDASYDDILMRTYRRADGARVMLALAYGSRQTQEIKIHRPELCYYAQGFEVRTLGNRTVTLRGSTRALSHALLTLNRSRVEVVTYWIRVGEQLANDPWAMRWTIFSEGIRGRVPDGLLVRASSLAESAERTEEELALQHAFLADLYREVPDETRRFLVGGPQVLL